MHPDEGMKGREGKGPVNNHPDQVDQQDDDHAPVDQDHDLQTSSVFRAAMRRLDQRRTSPGLADGFFIGLLTLIRRHGGNMHAFCQWKKPQTRHNFHHNFHR